jgi:hypothetical protein
MQTALTTYTYGKIICKAEDAVYRFRGVECTSWCDVIRGDTIFIVTVNGLRLEGKVVKVDLENQIVTLEDGHTILVASMVFMGRID